MATKDCASIIAQTLGEDSVDKEFAKRAVKELRAIKKQMELLGKKEQFRSEAIKYLNQERLLSENQVRQMYFERVKSKERLTQYAPFSQRRGKGLQAAISGHWSSSLGAGDSLVSKSFGRAAGYYGILENKLKDELKIFQSGMLDREVSIEIDSFSRTGEFKTQDGIAQKIAVNVARMNKQMLLDKRASGITTKEMMGYIVRQSHNADKLLKVNKEQWVSDIYGRLDLDRSFSDVSVKQEVNPTTGEIKEFSVESQIKERLSETYDKITKGQYDAQLDDTVTDVNNVTIFDFQNLSKKYSGERSLHFKDGENWYEYNKQYGNDSLYNTISKTIDRVSKDVELIKKFGAIPEKAFEGDVARLRKQLKDDIKDLDLKAQEKKLAQFEADIFQARNEFNAFFGKNQFPIDRSIAKAGAAVRALNNLRMLGGVLKGAIVDLPMGAFALRNQAGLTFFESYSQGLKLYGKQLKEFVKGDQNIKAVADSLQLYSQLRAQDNYARFTNEDYHPGNLAKMQRFFFKLNGLSYHTEAARNSFSVVYANRLAKLAGTDFSNLDTIVKNGMQRHKLGDFEWKVISMAKETHDGIGDVISAQKIGELDDEAIRAIAKTAGIQKYNGLKFDPVRAKQEIQSRYAALVNDFAALAVPEPNIGDMQLLLRGTKPGEPLGEVLRFAAQFKGFGIAYNRSFATSNAISQGITGSDLKSLMNKSTATNVLTLGMESMAFAYMAESVGDVLLNKEPANPVSPETIGRMALKSGFMALSGDLMFGGATRNASFQDRVIGFAGGPTASTIVGEKGLISTIGGMTSADEDYEKEKAYRNAIDFAWKMIPGNNLLYTKYATEALIVDRLKEWADPGYIDNKQQYAPPLWEALDDTLRGR